MYYLDALVEYSGPEPGSRGTRIRDVPPSQLGVPLNFYLEHNLDSLGRDS